MLARRGAPCRRPQARAFSTHSDASLQISVLQRRYQKREIEPTAFFAELCNKIEANKASNAFIFRPPTEHICA